MTAQIWPDYNDQCSRQLKKKSLQLKTAVLSCSNSIFITYLLPCIINTVYGYVLFHYNKIQHLATKKYNATEVTTELELSNHGVKAFKYQNNIKTLKNKGKYDQ